MDDADIVKFQHFVIRWYEQNKRHFPWRYIFDPYKVFVSEVLLQQTQANVVVKPYEKIVNKYSSVNKLAKADRCFLRNIFKDIGLMYRADRLICMSNYMMEKFGGIPDTKEELISISGVGEYICNAILCFGFNKSYPIVDGNVLRVFEVFLDFKVYDTRSFHMKKAWQLAEMLMPEENYVDYNYAILDLGATLRTDERENIIRQYY